MISDPHEIEQRLRSPTTLFPRRVHTMRKLLGRSGHEVQRLHKALELIAYGSVDQPSPTLDECIEIAREALNKTMEPPMERDPLNQELDDLRASNKRLLEALARAKEALLDATNGDEYSEHIHTLKQIDEALGVTVTMG